LFADEGLSLLVVAELDNLPDFIHSNWFVCHFLYFYDVSYIISKESWFPNNHLTE